MRSPSSVPATPAPLAGIPFYRRILAYFAPDKLLLTALVVLIWIALLAGVLEGAAVGALTDAVLSDRPRADAPVRWLLAPLAGLDRPGRVALLAVAWLVLRATNDTVLLLREMVNNRI